MPTPELRSVGSAACGARALSSGCVASRAPASCHPLGLSLGLSVNAMGIWGFRIFLCVCELVNGDLADG
jgi:hypothetical protein